MLGSPSVHIFLGSHFFINPDGNTLWEKGQKNPCWCCVSEDDEAEGLVCTVICSVLPIGFNDSKGFGPENVGLIFPMK